MKQKHKESNKRKAKRRKAKQSVQLDLDLLNFKSMIGKAFGGSRLKGNPKSKRPFSRKHLIHLILKSSYAKGSNSFLHKRNRKAIDHTVRSLAKRFGVELKNYVNVGNHLHLLLKATHRSQITKFLRALAGVIPRKVLNCEKGKPLGFRFWDARPFTKIIAEGLRPFRNIKQYFDKNRKQAAFRKIQKDVEGFDHYTLLSTDTA